ncbi:hypothetical protein AB833_03890 [Chromatiales bacterium (ex Bugula neritina AB1)]|nr:hypothetical protein AB833_03890 [Chromatiales bacterium (ex Bugula neritina AB1)]
MQGVEQQRIAVFDLDGTISRRDTYLTFLYHCLVKRPQRCVKLPLLPCYVLAYKLGFKSNHWLKARFLKAIAGGLSRAELEEFATSFTQITFDNNIKPEALAELQRLRDSGYMLVLATASFDIYVSKLFDALGMDKLFCTIAEFDADDRLTGELKTLNCIGEEKARQIKAWLQDTTRAEVDRAYSDSAVDLPLLALAQRAIVVDPKTATARVAAKLNYPIVRWK